MERMRIRLDGEAGRGLPVPIPSGMTGSDWRSGLPVIEGVSVMLRDLRLQDAPSLMAMLAVDDAACFMSPPPTDVQGFERFVTWIHGEREAGRAACFGIVPAGCDEAVGLFQVRQLEPGFATAEWGVVIGSAFWGTGIYAESAALVAAFAFETLGVHRLEARAAVLNGRANGALQKIGAVQEGLLRRSLPRNGQHLDQILWAILREDWYRSGSRRRTRVH